MLKTVYCQQWQVLQDTEYTTESQYRPNTRLLVPNNPTLPAENRTEAK